MTQAFDFLNSLHFDILRELGNIGAGNAVTALSKLLGRKVDMNVPKVDLLEFREVSNIIGGAEDLLFGVLVGISGDIDGIMMFLVRLNSARTLINALIGSEGGDKENFSDIDRSAIQEIGNILSSSYLSALSTVISKTITPSVPFLAMDMAGAILSVPAIEFGKIADGVLFIESIFNTEDNESVSGYFILVPDLPSFRIILASLGVE